MTCFAATKSRELVAALVVLLGLTTALPAGAGGPKLSDEELVNFLLGPRYAQWLVGAVSWMATAKEIEEYLEVPSDEEAERFIEEFWRRRNPYPQRPDNALLAEFEKRATEADRQFTEAGVPGRRTARGTLFILYGEPSETDFDIAPIPGDPPILVWRYDKDVPKGLDDDRPARTYRFIKRGDVTQFYVAGSIEERRRALDRRGRPTPPPPRRP